ncbi:MAG: exo 1,3/1,4-beta-D-glucan glucohydrolase [Pseudomonadota bacterium]|nr:exo 1,3/1,4-beta-D-glucan glucohydrolase [Pseudomonadota bacterium]
MTLRGRVVASLLCASLCANFVAAQVPQVRVKWPEVQSRVPRDAAVEARVERILSRMSLEEKVGQIIQADISAITPEELKRYKLGSVLAGGNSSPGGNEKAPAAEWLKLMDAMWEASMTADWAGEKIPMIFGIDSVHGNGNVVGATVFPHNIGLGAMRNPELVRKVGEVTAREMVVTGFDWDFSPTVAVPRDDRWGRTYEGWSEDPSVPRQYAPAMVEGLQGKAGTKEFMGPGRVIATAKHFVGDGGTSEGRDQGDNPSTDKQIRDIHGAGYPPAIEAGVQAVMASYNSVRGTKMHGNRPLLTDALKGDMNFDGLVVGDWNGHGQVPGCSNTSCAASVNAGLDMFMAPDSWKGLYDSTLAQARSGEIPKARLDDAVRRVLRVKVRYGLFEKPKPSARPLAGQFEMLGSAEHRAVARQAVRESLVLLKNKGNLLPLSPKLNVLVAGDGADNIPKQSGGWTISWQGTDITNQDFPQGQSIYAGIREAVGAGGGRATLSADGAITAKPDVAIVVFGESPYAEMVGDRPTVEYSPSDKKDLELLKKLKAAGIPTVAVLLSGRPLWVNPEINASDAFVAAFLPGSEGGGVADVLFKDPAGKVRHDFKGKLSYSWPKRADQTPLNVGDASYDPLFAFGYGLKYGQPGDLPTLSEDRPPPSATGADGVYFARGATPPGWRLAPSGGASVRAIDRRGQEDTRLVTFTGSGPQVFTLTATQPLDISRETNAQLSLVFDVRVDAAPTAPVTVAIDGKAVPITGALRKTGEWQSLAIPLGCFKTAGADMSKVSTPFTLATAGKLSIAISDIRLASVTVPQDRCSL